MIFGTLSMASTFAPYLSSLFPQNDPLMTFRHNTYHPPFSTTGYAETCLRVRRPYILPALQDPFGVR